MSAVAQPKGSDTTAIHPFHVNVPETELIELRKRVSETTSVHCAHSEQSRSVRSPQILVCGLLIGSSG